jgi:hypothetical protein
MSNLRCARPHLRMVLNPFNWSSPPDDPAQIVGRDAFAHDVALQLKAGMNVALFGPHKMGKTTFTRKLAEELRRDHGEGAPPFIVVSINLKRVVSIRALIGCVHEAVLDSRLSASARRKVLGELKFVEDQLRFSLKLLSHRRTVRAVEALQADENVLSAVLSALRAIGTHVVVIFDEFQRLASCPGEPLLTIHSALMGPHSSHVSLFVTGSVRHALEELVTDSNSPFFEQFTQVELPRIDDGEFAEFLELQFAATRKPLGDGTADRLLALADSHPLRTQQLAYNTWALAATGSTVPPELVEDAFECMLTEESTRFDERESELLSGKDADRNGMALLYLLADRGWEGATSAEARAAFGLPEPRELYRVRQHLLRKGLVIHEPLSDEWMVSDPLFASWLRRISPVRYAAA